MLWELCPLWRGWSSEEPENTRDQTEVLMPASCSSETQWEAQTLYLQSRSAYFARLCQGLSENERSIGLELDGISSAGYVLLS